LIVDIHCFKQLAPLKWRFATKAVCPHLKQNRIHLRQQRIVAVKSSFKSNLTACLLTLLAYSLTPYSLVVLLPLFC
jgi:hypothetical protein